MLQHMCLVSSLASSTLFHALPSSFGSIRDPQQGLGRPEHWNPRCAVNYVSAYNLMWCCVDTNTSLALFQFIAYS